MNLRLLVSVLICAGVAGAASSCRRADTPAPAGRSTDVERRPAHAARPTRSATAAPRPEQPPVTRRRAHREPQPNRVEPAHAPAPRQSGPPTMPELQSDPRPPAARQPAAPPPVTDEQLAAAGLRKLTGRHLVLITDLPPQPAVDELAAVFDLAVPQWCAYFNMPRARAAGWKITGRLMQRAEPFRAVGLLPDDLPPFLHGYQHGPNIWMYEKSSDYYRRHIVLHEGTHAFMSELLGGMGPPWYMEGMAELLGTHRWRDGRLQLAYFPQTRDEVRQWGRIKVIQDAVAAGDGLSLDQIRAYGATAHLRVEAYAWCWAACALLDGHPQYREAFRQLPRHVTGTAADFARAADRLLPWHERELLEQWQLFTHDLDYGYDIPREAVLYAAEREAGGREAVTVQADRGWQSTGLRLEGPATYRLEASGRYQIAQTDVPWPCEPGGVTIRYHAGHPLGMLLGALRPVAWSGTEPTPLIDPLPLGLQAELRVERSAVLFLRVNDSPAERADNAGSATVRIHRLPDPAGQRSPD